MDQECMWEAAGTSSNLNGWGPVMNAEPFVYHCAPVFNGREELPGLHIAPGLHSVQVDSACELAPVELHFMIPCLHVRH